MNSDIKVGAISQMRKIASEEGIIALWKGVGPAMARAAALTASQLATYDESKQVSLLFPLLFSHSISSYNGFGSTNNLMILFSLIFLLYDL